jgi:hypothetical protein
VVMLCADYLELMALEEEWVQATLAIVPPLLQKYLIHIENGVSLASCCEHSTVVL